MTFRSILVPVDLAEPDLATPAFGAAAGFLGGTDGRLRLVNVQSVIAASFTEFVPADFDQVQRSHAEATLRELSTRTGASAERVSWTVRFGGVYPEVLAEASEWGADLIIVGSHRPAMSTYLLGSNATTIVRHATCSVLVVR